MPKIVKGLSVAEVIKIAKGADQTRAIDRQLYLQARNGFASFIMRYKTADGVPRSLGLGSFIPDPKTAKAAIDAAVAKVAAHRATLFNGDDPLVVAAKKATHRITFRQLAQDYLAIHGPTKTPRDLHDWNTRLETYAYPIIGNMRVAAVDTDDMVRVLKPLLKKAPTLKLLRLNVESIFEYAKTRKLRSNNPATWTDLLENLMPAPEHKVKHRRDMPVDEVPLFFRRLRDQPGMAAAATQFMIFTTARTKNILATRWREIDTKTATWSVAAMKNKLPWASPLSDPALELLARIRPANAKPDDFVFCRDDGRQLRHDAIRLEMKRLGSDANPHGLRTTFKRWAKQQLIYVKDLIEFQLAHVEGSETEKAYWGDEGLLDQRRPMMAAYARHVTGTTAGNVVQLHKRKR